MDVELLTKQLQEFAKEHQEIAAIYLFGSHVFGKPRKDSDIDIALLIADETKDFFDLGIKLDGELSRFTSNYKIEVIVLNGVSLRFQFEVISTGKLLVCNDDHFRIGWQVNMLTRYWDIKLFWKEWDRTYFERMKRGFTDAQRRQYQRARETLAATH